MGKTVVQLRSGKAVVENQTWDHPSKAMRDALNALTPSAGVPASYPDPDLYLARRVIRLLGGKLVSSTPVIQPPMGTVP